MSANYLLLFFACLLSSFTGVPKEVSNLFQWTVGLAFLAINTATRLRKMQSCSLLLASESRIFAHNVQTNPDLSFPLFCILRLI